MKKILLVLESRASYGYSKNLIQILEKDKKFKIKTVVTGTHLSKELGYSVKNLETDNIKIDYKLHFDNKLFLSSSLTNFLILYTPFLLSIGLMSDKSKHRLMSFISTLSLRIS